MITVCFPVFNGEKFIKKAIQATINQIEENKINATILISNNCSEDNTLTICKEFEQNFSYVKIFNQEKKLSLNQNHNFLLDKIETKYFVFHSHDDVRLEGFYDNCLNILEKMNDIVLCYTYADYVDEISNGIYREEKCQYMGQGNSFNKKFLNTIKNLETCAFHGVYRTEAVKKIGYLEDFLGSDHFFINKLSCIGSFYEIKKKLMIMNEPKSKWNDGSVEDKIKNNKEDKTFIFPFLKIYFYSLTFALKKQKNIFYNFILLISSLIYLFKFFINDINFIYKSIKKLKK